MAKQEIEFEFSLEKLTLKVKGSVEFVQKVQGGLNRTLGNLADIQRLALPATPAGPPNGQQTLPFETHTVEPANGHQQNGQPTEPAPTTEKTNKRKKSGVSLIGMLRDLKTEKFFAEARTIDAVRDRLKLMGHNYKPSDIAARLLGMTQGGELFRAQGEQGYIYRDTKFDDLPRTQEAPAEPAE